MGICGGMQMLGDMIRDPLGIESDQVEVQGLGILDVDTEFVGGQVDDSDRMPAWLPTSDFLRGHAA